MNLKLFAKNLVYRLVAILAFALLMLFIQWAVHVGKSTVSGWGWKTFSSVENGFSAEFPKSPEQEVVNGRMNDSRFRDAKFFLAEKNRRAYAIAVGDEFNDVSGSFTQDEILDAARDGALGNLKGKLIWETKISKNGFPGREFDFTALGGDGRMRVYVVGKRRLVASVFGENARFSRDTTRFLESFEIQSK